MQKLLKILKWLILIGVIIGIIAIIFLAVFIARASKGLPSVETLKDYRPPVMSRVHAGDGKLISEFRKEARVFVPIESVPKQLQHAFVASLNYFGKPMKDLNLAEIAYLAVLPKGPANYQVGNPEKKVRALRRRNYVLDRMAEDGYASSEDVTEAKATDIVVQERFAGEEYLAAEYFVEEARKQVFKMYGEDELYEGGLSIRTTLDTRMQLAARQALRKGLESYDRRRGYRGAFARIEDFADWKKKLNDIESPRDIGNWRVALVLSIEGETAKLGFADKLTEKPLKETDESKDHER